MLSSWRQRLLPEAPQWRFLTGLALLAGGIALGIAGLAIFLFGEPRIAGSLAWREAAIGLAAASAPLILGGVSLALPARVPLRIATAAGALTTGWAIALFVRFYPHNFNVAALGLEDKAPLVATVYASGTAILAAALLVQVVAMALRRHGADEGEGIWEDTYEVSDRTVERDIDDAMRRFGVSWGSAPRAMPGIEVSVPGFGSGTTVRGQSAARRVRLEMPELDDRSKRLRQLGVAAVQVPGAGIDDASGALGALQRERAAHPRKYRPPRRNWWQRLWAW